MSDLPDEFVPGDAVVIEDAPACPECDRVLGPAAREYEAVEHDGETWCRECVFETAEAVVTADERLRCPNCYLETPYRRSKALDDALCHGCGAKFHAGRGKEVER